MGVYTRQQLAAEFGLSVHTIRHYVRTGTIPPPTHIVGPPERYDDRHVRAIRKARRDVIDHNRTLKELPDMPDHWNPRVWDEEDEADERWIMRLVDGPG